MYAFRIRGAYASINTCLTRAVLCGRIFPMVGRSRCSDYQEGNRMGNNPVGGLLFIFAVNRDRRKEKIDININGGKL